MLPLRLRRVPGYEGRLNDALFQPAHARPARPARPQTLVFFGGDVQDYPEAMQAHRDNRNYLKWNLENTARMLGRNFLTNISWLCDRLGKLIEYKSFSCYDNFVPCLNAGLPDHTPTFNALHHLERLLQGVSSRVKSLPTSELLEAVTSVSLPEEIDIEDLHNSSIHKAEHKNGTKSGPPQSTSDQPPTDADAERKPDTDPLWWHEKLALDESQLTLVGFSKGCVVLNQLIYEFHYTKTLTPGDSHMMKFMERITDMYWLDGGHAAGKNTWITSRSLLETLTRLNVNVYVHVSPYQVQDVTRPWIGKEEKIFTSLLKKLGAKVKRYFHEQSNPTPSLQMHFEVLANFKRVQESAPGPASANPDEDT